MFLKVFLLCFFQKIQFCQFPLIRHHISNFILFDHCWFAWLTNFYKWSNIDAWRFKLYYIIWPIQINRKLIFLKFLIFIIFDVIDKGNFRSAKMTPENQNLIILKLEKQASVYCCFLAKLIRCRNRDPLFLICLGKIFWSILRNNFFPWDQLLWDGRTIWIFWRFIHFHIFAFVFLIVQTIYFFKIKHFYFGYVWGATQLV